MRHTKIFRDIDESVFKKIERNLKQHKDLEDHTKKYLLKKLRRVKKSYRDHKGGPTNKTTEQRIAGKIRGLEIISGTDLDNIRERKKELREKVMQRRRSGKFTPSKLSILAKTLQDDKGTRRENERRTQKYADKMASYESSPTALRNKTLDSFGV